MNKRNYWTTVLVNMGRNHTNLEYPKVPGYLSEKTGFKPKMSIRDH